MATSEEFAQYVVDQAGRSVGSENLSVRKMFGEYALYFEGKTVGLICDNALFIRITDETREMLGSHQTGFPYPGAKPWYAMDESDLDDGELMSRLILAVADRPEPKGRRSK